MDIVVLAFKSLTTSVCSFYCIFLELYVYCQFISVLFLTYFFPLIASVDFLHKNYCYTNSSSSFSPIPRNTYGWDLCLLCCCDGSPVYLGKR